MKHNNTLFFVVTLSLVLTSIGCSTQGRYKIRSDRAPTALPDVSQVEPAHPKYEPYSRGGNKNYTVRGQSYQVLKTGKGYRAEGTASWYGAKFHGHLTSNGEIYDMYSMSAAHKSLPLPSYAKVTNLANHKHVVVRINDRGPFHGGRILDLSYAAAYHLDMLSTGTANIAMEVIHFPSPTEAALAPHNKQYIQLLASSNESKLHELATSLREQYAVEARVIPKKSLFLLQLGPFSQSTLADKLLGTLQQAGYPNSYIISK